MKHLSKLLLTFTILLVFHTAYPQAGELDSVQVERVARTCELWGHMKYFHPYLDDGNVDWERAFADNIEGVIAAQSSGEYGEAIAKMLSQLNDPATRIIPGGKPLTSADTLKHPVLAYTGDSVLLLRVNDYSDLEDYSNALERFSALADKLPRSNGAIIDLRSPEDIGEYKGYIPWIFNQIETRLSNEPVELPGFQARFHDGFAPEGGMTSGGYRSGDYTVDKRVIMPAANTADKPIVFVVNEHSDIPLQAIGLQLAGKARFISPQHLTDAAVVSTYMLKLDDSLTVSIRTSELPPGSKIKTDLLIPASAGDAEVITLAMKLLEKAPGDDAGATTNQPEAWAANGLKEQSAEDINTAFPDTGNRLLAAAKIWTVIHYFFAYQDLMEDDWNEVLRTYIPRLYAASDSLEYNLAVAEMYTHIQDGHGFIRSQTLSNYLGKASTPLKISVIEDQPVVVNMIPDSVYKVNDVEVGDIILEVDGEKVADRFARYGRYISSSNEWWLKQRVANVFLNGKDETEALLQIQKADGSIVQVSLPRKAAYSDLLRQLGNNRNEQPVTRLINEDIGYADLDRLTKDMVDQMFTDFKDTKAIIFDVRGYPKGTAWTIAPHLTDENKVYAASFRRFSPMGISTGSDRHMTHFDQALPPSKSPTYRGKTVMLIDERTMSQAEHTGLFLEAANGTEFIGSPTAGANGDVTSFNIPGNITLFFSGHDVRHIDGRQLQKTGLEPDVKASPTIEGIRKGEDEVLQKAIMYVSEVIGM